MRRHDDVSQVRLADAIGGRDYQSQLVTDGRTDEPQTTITNPHQSLSATRARVQRFDVIGLGEVLAAGILPTGERFPVIRTGEREPIPYQVRAAVWLRDRGICQRCQYRNPKPWELDHIVPWSAGGSDDSTNLRVLCEPCNQKRSNYDDRSTFARRPVTWWCDRCYGEEHAWRYGEASAHCPTHRHNADGYAPGCAVERVYRWQASRDEEPSWHQRPPVLAADSIAFCAHCGLPGMTDVAL